MKKKKQKPAPEVLDAPDDREVSEEQDTAPSESDGVETAAEEAASSAAEAVVKEEPLQMKLLRLQADFDNFRKRTLRERGQIAQRALEDHISELLPVLDHFELGLATAEQHHADRAVIDGFKLVFDQLTAALKKAGLSPIDAEGEMFDPHLHEAATHMPSEEHPDLLGGTPGSPGKITGIARVIINLEDAGKLSEGEILVTATTSPPWTPLFATAGGIVTDTGGALSHCAIVAREYDIPAVVGTGMATAIIKDGQMIEVDGDTGDVRLL